MNEFEKASWENEKDDYVYDGMSQENCIEFLRNSKTATVTLSQGRLISKIKKLAKKYPSEVKIKHENKDGSIVAHIPVSYIHINNYSGNMSEENRNKAAARLKKYHAEKNKD